MAALVVGIVLRSRARRRDHRIMAAAAIPASLAVLMAVMAAIGVWPESLDLLLSPSGFMATLALAMIAVLILRPGGLFATHEIGALLNRRARKRKDVQ